MKVNKSELIDTLAKRVHPLPQHDVDQAVKTLIDSMSQTLAVGERIEIRAFGSFPLHYRLPGVTRNPKTGKSVAVGPRAVVHFRPGKQLRDRVNGRPLVGVVLGSITLDSSVDDVWSPSTRRPSHFRDFAGYPDGTVAQFLKSFARPHH